MSNTFKLPCGSIVTNNQTTYGTLENLYTIDLEKGLVCAKHFLEDMKITWSIEAINMEFNFDIIPIYQVDAMDYFHSITKQPFVKPLDLLLLLTLSKDKYYIKRTRDFICSTLIPFINKNKIKHDDFKKETIMSKVTPIENHSQKFHSDLFGDLTVLTHADGSLWFIGNEVCEKLGYSNPRKAISDHCKGCNETLLPSKGGMQTMKIIPERDVYRLVMRSKLPTAEKFEEFVVSEVLPSIRKTGGYGQSNAALPNFADPAEAAIAWANQYKEKSALQLELKAKDEILEQAKPMIGFAETVQKAEKGILVRELAYLAQNESEIKIGEKRLWNWLRTMGFVHQRSTRPIQEYVERGYFVMQPTIVHHHTGAQEHMTTKITGKGQIYFINNKKGETTCQNI